MLVMGRSRVLILYMYLPHLDNMQGEAPLGMTRLSWTGNFPGLQNATLQLHWMLCYRAGGGTWHSWPRSQARAKSLSAWSSAWGESPGAIDVQSDILSAAGCAAQ